MDKEEKPKIPEGYRELPVGESTKAGDLKWFPETKKWREVAPGAKHRVSTLRKGWYCRKLD